MKKNSYAKEKVTLKLAEEAVLKRKRTHDLE